MSQKLETLADLKAEAAKLRAQNDAMISGAKAVLDDVQKTMDKAEKQAGAET